MINRPQISFPFPVKGVTENSAYGTVPEGFALGALNVVSFDVVEGRLRGGKRPGTGRAIYYPVHSSGFAVQRMRQVVLDSAEFIDAAEFFDDPFYDIGSGPTGEGFGGGWGFPRYDWDFTIDPDGPGGFGTSGIDPERDSGPPVPPRLIWIETFPYPDGWLVGPGGWFFTANPVLGVSGRKMKMRSPYTFTNSFQQAQNFSADFANLDTTKSFTISFRVFVPTTPNGPVSAQIEQYDASLAFYTGSGAQQLMLTVISRTDTVPNTIYILRVTTPTASADYPITPGSAFTVRASWDAGTQTLSLYQNNTFLGSHTVASWSPFGGLVASMSGGYAPNGGALGFEPRKMNETWIDNIIIQQDEL